MCTTDSHGKALESRVERETFTMGQINYPFIQCEFIFRYHSGFFCVFHASSAIRTLKPHTLVSLLNTLAILQRQTGVKESFKTDCLYWEANENRKWQKWRIRKPNTQNNITFSLFKMKNVHKDVLLEAYINIWCYTWVLIRNNRHYYKELEMLY